jgi:hypothetical protein
MQGREDIFRPKLGAGAEDCPEISKELRADMLIKNVIGTGQTRAVSGPFRPIAPHESAIANGSQLSACRSFRPFGSSGLECRRISRLSLPTWRPSWAGPPITPWTHAKRATFFRLFLFMRISIERSWWIRRLPGAATAAPCPEELDGVIVAFARGTNLLPCDQG